MIEKLWEHQSRRGKEKSPLRAPPFAVTAFPASLRSSAFLPGTSLPLPEELSLAFLVVWRLSEKMFIPFLRGARSQ